MDAQSIVGLLMNFIIRVSWNLSLSWGARFKSSPRTHARTAGEESRKSAKASNDVMPCANFELSCAPEVSHSQNWKGTTRKR